MNFVDVQPKSFLDYAWTTPSPAPASTAKPSKTSRKQNRCCDQCRKGKRACDAAILEDTLLDASGTSASNPTVFHYSDNFGPLAPCSNCEKTKKNCTFEWLRSQRLSQATPPSNTAPPPKRRRTQSNSSNNSHNRVEGVRQQAREAKAPQPAVLPDTADGGDFVSRTTPIEYGVTFADFPGGIPSFDWSIPSMFPTDHTGLGSGGIVPSAVDSLDSLSEMIQDDEEGTPLDRDSGHGSSVDTCSETMSESPDASPFTGGPPAAVKAEKHVNGNGTVARLPHKKRRRSTSSALSNGASYPALSLASNFLSTTNNTFLTEGLLKIYHDSFENALSCWLTERTCPYSKGSDLSLANDTGPDWNRIYHRVFRLDRLASSVRGRNLSFAEDKAASKALNLAIFSFATQWAQSGERSKSKYPFHNSGIDEKSYAFTGESGGTDFDRKLQISAWHEARMALQSASEIESFRVVLAQIVFSLTQRPIGPEETNGKDVNKPSMDAADVPAGVHCGEDATFETNQSEDKEMAECEDLLSKLNLTIDGEGPPVHLEQGLRLIHSLRSRMTMTGNGFPRPKASPRNAKQTRMTPNSLDASDRATVDLLFWLGVMFDTLSSAMHKRPLVVSDEDSDIYSNEPRPAQNETCNGKPSNDAVAIAPAPTEGLWDNYLFARQRNRLQGNPVRWPCSFDQAASLLCDAAPVKVLLFRKVTRIQTLLSRNARGERVEKAIRDALDVYAHWEKLYAPFIRDCIDKHDRLPSRIQSWYICLTGHWHLATLLLADLIEIVDDSELSTEVCRNNRMSSAFVANFRERNCYSLSDLARCACPREDASFPNSNEFHFAVKQGALLTEPWTAVLIRAFATAGVILLESETPPNSTSPDPFYQEQNFRKADDCVKALWYLGRKSDISLSAAKILGDALKQRRKGVDEKVNDMSSFLEAELWEGFEEMHGAFGVECV
ncbi:hypothetical protein BS50DRAFT_588759 [Corynespora cassiicola Philippines]|uniref:Zn(2)-C6 fungal-type domain-containing protein n=1 Tax=Corynespora cassiicola Philippines TaxID=1448308 RepID=A0A2T2NKQ5_CORCC|nr:hypothetical protein BS50DRAFT_588759 [Corynespora cassiicola Philippines]